MSADREPETALGMWDDECGAPWLYGVLYALTVVAAIAGSVLLPWGWAVPP